MVCIVIYENDPVYQGNVQKVCYSEYELQGDRKPAGSTSNAVKAGRTVMIRDLFLIFCSLLSKMGSVLQSSVSGDMTLLALCLPKLNTHFWKWQTSCISIPSPFLPVFLFL